MTKVFTDFIHSVKFPEFDNYCGENTKEGNYEGIGYYLRGELIEPIPKNVKNVGVVREGKWLFQVIEDFRKECQS